MKYNFFALIFFASYIFVYTQEFASVAKEAIKTLQEYLAIDTTNPPGNEIKTAKYLKQILDKEGIENQIFDMGDGRANLLGVLRGNGEKKGIILLHHMDVVPADSNHWKVHPFSGEIIDGEIYGRGTIDIKGKGIIDLFSLIYIKRLKLPLKRDILLLAVADEEMVSLGTRWMIANQLNVLKNAEFLIDEGACIIVDEGETYQNYLVTLGEKSPLWLTLSFSGKSGHGSIPMEDSAINRALRAANRILDYKTNFIVLPYLKEYIRMLLGEEDITKIPGFDRDFESSLKNKTFLTEISRNPEINASIRNTISITCLKGSDKINTIPNEASISLDCRLLPSVDKDNFIKELRTIVQDDTVVFKIEEFSPSTCSSWDNDFSKALNICAKKKNPSAKVIPSILLSSTDSTHYRPLGIHAYGFEPYKLTLYQRDLAHGNNERIKVENIQFGIELLTDILKELNGE